MIRPLSSLLIGQVGDTVCTTDWLSIPCATTSTAGSSKQAAGSSPDTCIGESHVRSRALSWRRMFRETLRLRVLLGDQQPGQQERTLPHLQFRQAFHNQV